MKETNNKPPFKYIYLSVLASILTIVLKSSAAYITDSVGLFSDAMESVVNLAAALMALYIMRIAFTPPDKKHPFGHTKAEYFSSFVEGFLILFASLAIITSAYKKILYPNKIEQIGIGLFISVIASIINLGVGVLLIKMGKKLNSIILEADGKHLLTDVWTTAGVLVGLIVVQLTDLYILDPIIGLLVALNIIYTGVKLIRDSISGFMDTAVSEQDEELIKNIINSICKEPIQFHSLYTRQSASKIFITFHLLVPDEWSIALGHTLTLELENKIKNRFNGSEVFIHLEPLNSPESYDDYLEKI
jgi:cation diffusion facilitator family transporter